MNTMTFYPRKTHIFLYSSSITNRIRRYPTLRLLYTNIVHVRVQPDYHPTPSDTYYDLHNIVSHFTMHRLQSYKLSIPTGNPSRTNINKSIDTRQYIPILLSMRPLWYPNIRTAFLCYSNCKTSIRAIPYAVLNISYDPFSPIGVPQGVGLYTAIR